MRCSSLAALRCENHTHSVPQPARQRRPETRLSVCHLRETPEPPPPHPSAPLRSAVHPSFSILCCLFHPPLLQPYYWLRLRLRGGEENKCTRRGIWRNIWGLPACRDVIGCDFERAQERGGSPGRLRFRSTVQPGRSWQTWLSFFLFFSFPSSFFYLLFSSSLERLHSFSA